MENYFDMTYDLSEKVLQSFKNSDFSKTVALLEEEKQHYNNLDYLKLYGIMQNTCTLEELENTFYYDNYELALYNKEKSFILRRMFIYANKVLANRFDPADTENEMFKLDNTKYMIVNPNNIIYELSSKLYSNIETKFILFLTNNSKISNERKSYMISSLMFIDPYLQDKIFSKQIILHDYIKKEDDLYENLWDNVKKIYEEKMDYICDTGIYNTINLMLSSIDVNNEENILIREMYLRTLFNYTDEEFLEDINYEFNSSDLDIQNEFGYNQVINAFRSINKDTEMINKIKIK